jgi:hypothetical protein
MSRRRCICRVILEFREVIGLVVRGCLVGRWWEHWGGLLVVLRRVSFFFYFISGVAFQVTCKCPRSATTIDHVAGLMLRTSNRIGE